MINIWWMWHLCNAILLRKRYWTCSTIRCPFVPGLVLQCDIRLQAKHVTKSWDPDQVIDISGSAIEVLLRILMDFECDFAFGSSKGVASPNLRSAPCDWPLCQHLRFGPGVLGQNQSRKLQVVQWHGSGTCLTFWGRSRAGWKGRLADEVIPWSNPQALTLFPAWSPVDRIHKSSLSNHKIMLHKKSQAFSQNFESLFHPWSSLGYLWIMNWHHPLAWHSWLDAVVRLQRLLESRKALTCNQAVIAAIALLELLTCYQVKWLCPSNFVPRGRISCSCGISWTARLIQPRRFFGRVVLWCLLLIWIHLEGKCR
jgi:hypothetical protein